MLKIPVKEGENIERALKRFKRKFEKTGISKELRERQAYTKPSEIKREMVKKAVYKRQIQEEEE
jgi:small subunit ribosomal protein S21